MHPSGADNAENDPFAVLPQAKHHMASNFFATGTIDSSTPKILNKESFFVNRVSESPNVI